jgi:hypothetical protein
MVVEVKYLPEGLPGMGFKRTARQWKQTLVDLVERPYAFVVQQMQTAGPNCEPSYLSRLLEPGTTNLSPEELFVAKWSAVSLYGGGADTVRSNKVLSVLSRRMLTSSLDCIVNGMLLRCHDIVP